MSTRRLRTSPWWRCRYNRRAGDRVCRRPTGCTTRRNTRSWGGISNASHCSGQQRGSRACQPRRVQAVARPATRPKAPHWSKFAAKESIPSGPEASERLKVITQWCVASSDWINPGGREIAPHGALLTPPTPVASDPLPESLAQKEDWAPTVSGTSASVPENKLKYQEPRKSNSAAPKTDITLIPASARYPRPGWNSSLGTEIIQVPLMFPADTHSGGCGRRQMAVGECFSRHSKKFYWQAWLRKHLAEDINPYTCIVAGCPTPHVYYSTRSALEQHLRHDHAPTWQCPLQPRHRSSGILHHGCHHEPLPSRAQGRSFRRLPSDAHAMVLTADYGDWGVPSLCVVWFTRLARADRSCARARPWLFAALAPVAERSALRSRFRSWDVQSWGKERRPSDAVAGQYRGLDESAKDQTPLLQLSVQYDLDRLTLLSDEKEPHVPNYFTNNDYFAVESRDGSANPQTNHSPTCSEFPEFTSRRKSQPDKNKEQQLKKSRPSYAPGPILEMTTVSLQWLPVPECSYGAHVLRSRNATKTTDHLRFAIRKRDAEKTLWQAIGVLTLNDDLLQKVSVPTSCLRSAKLTSGIRRSMAGC